MKKLLFLLLTACLLTGCTTTKYVTVPEYHTDTLYKSRVVHDSIWQHDSTYIREKGDTLIIEKWHNKYVIKELTDTFYQSSIDSIPVPYPVEKLVEKPLHWWQRTLMYIGSAAILLLLLYIMIRIKKE